VALTGRPVREIDLAIVGAGVAGLTAAAVAAQHGLQVLVIERMGAGGQVMNVEQVANYPGFPQGVAGFELGPLLQEQAEAAGAQFLLDTVEGIDPVPGGRHLVRCMGETVAARAVLVAAGSTRRYLGVPGEDSLEGRGVSHCASCDGPLFRGQPVCVAGGGDSAFGEALVLAGHASRVTIVFREEQPHAQRYLVQAVANLPNVELVRRCEILEIIGDDSGVTGVRLQVASEPTGALPVRGVFVYAGLVPDTGFLGGALQLDAAGRIETDAALRTSVRGIFAAGDIRAGSPSLLAAASGDGAMAAASAFSYLREASA
jgi:thioredoxin reductase (NADPH)